MSDMTDIDNFLAEADKNSPYIKFEDGEPVTGIYKGAKLVEDTFNKGEQTMEYTLEVDKVSKTFKSRSVKLASQIKEHKDGDEIEVVKTGIGFDTNWYVGEAKWYARRTTRADL